MSVTVSVRSYTHAVTYVTDNILKSLKDILLHSGLDPAKLASDREVLHRGIKAWIDSAHLRKIVLEVFVPATRSLVGRWDINVAYDWTGDDGSFWTDTDMIRKAISKAGLMPATAIYRVVIDLAPGAPEVSGWDSTSFLSTSGMIEQRIGTTVEASGLSTGFSYYRRIP